MQRRPLIIFLAVLLASCAAGLQRPSWDYKVLSAQPTPHQWQVGAVWTFLISPKSGKPESLTFRVTGDTATTCSSGDWRKLELVEGRPGSFAGTPSKVAYQVTGRFLWISLNSNWCDANDDIRGGLDGATFAGERTWGGITGSSLVGAVQGWWVR